MAVVLLVLLDACGLPGEGSTHVVEGKSVPYGLLDLEPTRSPSVGGGKESLRVPITFWVGENDRVVPAVVGGSCSAPPIETAERLLAELAQGPDESLQAAGKYSALPPASAVRLISVDGDTARVEVVPASPISAELLPLAVGQVVLSLASAPGIEYIVLERSGSAVEVPLPGGALVDRPVTAEDFASLLAPRYVEPGERARSSDLGCS